MEPALLACIVSFIFIGAGLYLKNKHNESLQEWLTAEAVVYRIENDFGLEWGNTNQSRTKNRTIIVRFTTAKEEWITEKLNNAFISSTLQEGDPIDILYNPENPYEFTVNSDLNLRIAPLLFIIGGSAAFVLSLLEYTQLVQLF